MTTLTTAWMLGCVFGSGFLVGAVVASGRRRHHTGNCEPMPPAPPYSSAAIAWQAEAEASRAKFIDPSIQRIYRGAMWREKGSDVWHPIGKEPDWVELARQQLNRTTPPLKPQPPGGRLMHEGQLFGGYQPRSQGGTTTPPPREP